VAVAVALILGQLHLGGLAAADLQGQLRLVQWEHQGKAMPAVMRQLTLLLPLHLAAVEAVQAVLD
jgi:hypothetical protein